MSDTMMAALLYGPRDMRVEQIPRPAPPGPGMALLRVTAVGVCGSDLHTYMDGRIGEWVVAAPLVLGHEFGGVVEAVGPEAYDGNFAPLQIGTRVAVDPAQPCGRCEMCEQGHPNLCHRLHFCGLYPDGGSLCEYIVMPAHCCFPVPATIDDAGRCYVGAAWYRPARCRPGKAPCRRQRRHPGRRPHRPAAPPGGKTCRRRSHLRDRPVRLAAGAGTALRRSPHQFRRGRSCPGSHAGDGRPRRRCRHGSRVGRPLGAAGSRHGTHGRAPRPGRHPRARTSSR